MRFPQAGAGFERFDQAGRQAGWASCCSGSTQHGCEAGGPVTRACTPAHHTPWQVATLQGQPSAEACCRTCRAWGGGNSSSTDAGGGGSAPSRCNAWNWCGRPEGCRLPLDDGGALELRRGGCELRFQARRAGCGAGESGWGRAAQRGGRAGPCMPAALPPHMGTECGCCTTAAPPRPALPPCTQDLIEPGMAYPAALLAKGPEVPFTAGGPLMTAGPRVRACGKPEGGGKRVVCPDSVPWGCPLLLANASAARCLAAGGPRDPLSLALPPPTNRSCPGTATCRAGGCSATGGSTAAAASGAGAARARGSPERQPEGMPPPASRCLQAGGGQAPYWLPNPPNTALPNPP